MNESIILKNENDIENELDLHTLTEEDLFIAINETSKLVADNMATNLVDSAIASQNANVLTDNVEFWKWMNRNYQKSGIFNGGDALQKYISSSPGKEEWVNKQLQGKGYEWDWMADQRSKLNNVFKTYDAGDVANRAASDVTERNILTNKTKEYQMKAYTSKTNPNLKNTPKDMTVVTNSEKVDVVKKNGYTDVQEYKDNSIIKKETQQRLEGAKEGKAVPTYTPKGVISTMATSGLFCAVVGMGFETYSSYKAWKSKRISNEEYLKEIAKAGGDAGVTGGVTSGIMIPVSAAITAAGVSTIITIPIAFVVSSTVNKIVAPCFGRGDYKKYIEEAKYYQNLEKAYDDLLVSMTITANEYYRFISTMDGQMKTYNNMKSMSGIMDAELIKLYETI